MVRQNDYSDEQLLASIKQDDVEAFAVLYERYWDRMLSLAIVKLRDNIHAEEVVQEVFVDLWKRRQELVITSKLSSYIAVAVKYRILNIQAKQAKAKAYRSFIRQSGTDKTNVTEDWLTFEDLKSQLEETISELPDKGQLAFRLSREEGLTHKEIAIKLSMTEKAVERNISRSVKYLFMNLKHLITVAIFMF